MQDTFLPRKFITAGPDEEFGTEDDRVFEAPSKAQEALDSIKPLAAAFGFGHYVALGQAGLALVTLGVGAAVPGRKEDPIGDAPAA